MARPFPQLSLSILYAVAFEDELFTCAGYWISFVPQGEPLAARADGLGFRTPIAEPHVETRAPWLGPADQELTAGGDLVQLSAWQERAGNGRKTWFSRVTAAHDFDSRAALPALIKN